MIWHLFLRLLHGGVILLVILSFLAYGLVHLIPGDFIDSLRPLADLGFVG